MNSGYPWRQRIIPKSFTCRLMGTGCSNEKCPCYMPYGVYLRSFEECPERRLEI